MTFVDSAAWGALFAPQDPLHAVATDWMQVNQDLLVTSDYVADEVLTLLKARFGAHLAIEAGQALWSETLSTLVYLDAADIAEAWRIFQRFTDKGWSFTDCASYAVMRRLGISRAFSFDRHFSQMPGIRRAP